MSAISVSPPESFGSIMRREMTEQSHVLAGLVARAPADRDLVRRLIPSAFAGVRFIARGSSANAALLGRYLIERAAGRPVSLAAPSLHTLYNVDVDHRDYMAIGLSQSGATPEITTVLRAMRHTGARTVAVTNDPVSTLAEAAELVYALEAGAEIAVPATKTVTGQMLAVTIIASAFGPCDMTDAELSALPQQVRRVLEAPSPAEQLAADWAPHTSRLLVVSRGYGYAAAREAALKITETTGIQAQPFSAADLRHGPIAIVGPHIPVLIIDTGGPGTSDLAELAELAHERGAHVAWCGPGGDAELPLPPGSAEPAAAILATVRAQQFALALALARGGNPDSPPGLSKVTVTH